MPYAQALYIPWRALFSSVAVIVRTKDRPVFLARALQNIAEQRYTQYTVYVVDDGGNQEESQQIIDRSPVAAQTVLLHAAGGNMEAASNLGVRSSESTYIAIHDDDDLWDPQFLERTVATLDETGADMCVVRIIERFERQTEDGFIVLNECTFHEDLPAMGLQFLFRTNRAVPIGVLYRRTLHEQVGYFDEELPVVGDWEFNMRAAMAGEVQLLDEPLAYWCKRPDATGSAANSVSHEQQHRIFDAQVRANAIREDLAAGAHIGPYLYQAHLTNELDGRLLETLEALQDVQERLERLENMQQEQCERLHRMERAMSWSGKLSRLRAVFSPKDSSSK